MDRYPFSQLKLRQGMRRRGMDREQSIALWQKGKEAWNAWANRMLTRKAEMEQSKVWQLKKRNEETDDWIAKASVDFSGINFLPANFSKERPEGNEAPIRSPAVSDKFITVEGAFVDFDGFVFPWLAQFQHAKFRVGARFEGVQFHGPAQFSASQFHGPAVFEGTEFHKPTRFEVARFNGPAKFKDSYFYSWVWFFGARFTEAVAFQGAEFHGRTDFAENIGPHRLVDSTKFLNGANFTGVCFKEMATFQGAYFDGVNDFGEKTKFQSEADFAQADFHGQASFSGTQFEGPTDFLDAKFSRGASFANASFAGAASFKGAIFYTDDTSQKVADFTAIKADRAFDLNNATTSVPTFLEGSAATD